MPLTTAEIIDRAKVSGYLAANDISLGTAFGARKDGQLSTKILLVRKALEWGNTYSASDNTNIGNYLVWFCGNYGLEAQVIIDGGGGTPIVPVSPSGYTYTSFTHVVTSGESGVNTFTNIVLLDGENVTSMVVNGNSYYLIAGDFTFNKTIPLITWNTGTFTTGDTITINFSRKL